MSRDASRRMARSVGMVAIIEAAAQRVDQQFLRERAGEQFRTAEQRLAQGHYAVYLRTIGKLARGVDRLAGVARAPGADGIEILHREADGIHGFVTVCANRIGAMLGHLLAHGAGSLTLLIPFQRRYVRWRRRHRRTENVFEDPLAAHNRRGSLGVRCKRENASLPQQSAARIIGHGDAPEAAPINVRDAVMTGQALVHERVVRGQQIQHAAIFVHDALKEKLRLAAQRLSQIVVEIRK